MAIDKGKSLNPKYLFGSDEEIAGRDDRGNNPTLNSPPSFSQVRPANSDANAAAPGVRSRSGNLKFGSGV